MHIDHAAGDAYALSCGLCNGVLFTVDRALAVAVYHIAADVCAMSTSWWASIVARCYQPVIYYNHCSYMASRTSCSCGGENRHLAIVDIKVWPLHVAPFMLLLCY